MGTRSTTFVKYKGECKVAQYGQWDGYPSSVGVGILQVLRDGNRETVLASLDRTRWMTDKEIEVANTFLKERDAEVADYFPLLTRNSAGDFIMEVLNEQHLPLGEEEILLVQDEDTTWSQYIYEIDFDEGTFKVNGTNFDLDNLPEDDVFIQTLHIE